MGNRLSKLYTRTGDDGSSGLSGGSRVPKNHARMNAIGSVDELNSVIGLLISRLTDDELEEIYKAIQHDLFNIGGEISLPGSSFITQKKVSSLEVLIDQFNKSVSPLKEFIMPGGCEAASICHIARAVARRAERDLISLHHEDKVKKTTRRYINRLSDLLFVTARIINQRVGSPDVLWNKKLS